MLSLFPQWISKSPRRPYPQAVDNYVPIYPQPV
jgi:hypothetical protein